MKVFRHYLSDWFKENCDGEEKFVKYAQGVIYNASTMRFTLNPIPAQFKERAYQIARNIRESDIGGNDLGRSPYQKFNDMKGQLGNLVASYIFTDGIADALKEVTIGRRDIADLRFNGYKFDVKTAEYEVLKVWQRQLCRRDKDYYIAVSLDKEPNYGVNKSNIEKFWHDEKFITNQLLPQVFKKATVLGYLPANDVYDIVKEMTPQDDGNYSIPGKKLLPIAELIEAIRQPKSPM